MNPLVISRIPTKVAARARKIAVHTTTSWARDSGSTKFEVTPRGGGNVGSTSCRATRCIVESMATTCRWRLSKLSKEIRPAKGGMTTSISSSLVTKGAGKSNHALRPRLRQGDGNLDGPGRFPDRARLPHTATLGRPNRIGVDPRHRGRTALQQKHTVSEDEPDVPVVLGLFSILEERIHIPTPLPEPIQWTLVYRSYASSVSVRDCLPTFLHENSLIAKQLRGH